MFATSALSCSRNSSDGLWGLAFGNGNLAWDQPTNVLFFAADPNDDKDGLFGRIEASGTGACIASDND